MPQGDKKLAGSSFSTKKGPTIAKTKNNVTKKGKIPRPSKDPQTNAQQKALKVIN